MGSRIVFFLCVAFLAGCQGPRPEVGEVALLPDPHDPQRQLVEVTVENKSGGSGDAKLTVRLRSALAAVTYQGTEKVSLKPHERVRVRLGFPRLGSDYRPEAEARYPPD